MRADRPRRGHDLLRRRVGTRKRDVLTDGAREEEALLRDDSELAPERLLFHFPEIDVVERDRALLRVVEPRQQLRDRRLARPGVAHERDGRSRRDVERDSVQHFRAGPVGEVNVVEADMSLDPTELTRVGCVLDVRRLVEYVLDLVERGHGRKERVVELRQLLHRVEEVREVSEEGDQRPDRDRAAEDEIPAVAEDDCCRDRREEVDEGEVEAVQDDGLLVRIAVSLADLAEMPLVRLLARERLHDAHPCNVLRQRRRDGAQRLADRAVGAARALAEDRGRDGHPRHDRQRREREAPVEEEQDDRRPDERERVLDEARDAVGDELVERLDVVRQAANDHARTVPFVKTQRQPLQVTEEMVAEVGQHPLARPAGEVGLRVREHEPEHADDEEGDHDQLEPVELAVADALVDRELDQVRRRQRDERRSEQRPERERRPRLVRADQANERGQPALRLIPGPVLDLCASLLREMAPGLPDSHATSSASATTRSSRPCS